MLPPELVKEVQKYVQGQSLYILKSEKKVTWGTNSGIKEELLARNNEIVSLYQSGTSVTQLAELYFLSEDRIRTILRNRH